MVPDAFADAVIVAAGRSRRMGGVDKLDIELAGRSVLRRSVEAMLSAPAVADVVIVAAPERRERLAAGSWLPAGARTVAGGERRQDSVAAGVAAANAEVVLVHDAARPLVSTALIGRVAEAARRDGAAIPVVPVVDSLKQVEGERVTGVADRAGLYRAQTPQGARRELLADALAAHASGPDLVGDEAEVLGRAGVAVTTVEGDDVNLKITTPADVATARRLVGEGGARRTAFGSDSHPFGPVAGLRLGGIAIDDAPRLHGHSDGDVVLHALCDAILAAAGLGDLGRRFPAGDDATRGIDSAVLVADTVAAAAETGVRPASVDVTILGARPRIGARRLDAMADRMATLLGLEPGAISVKAATGNLAGDEGAGRVISATCLVEVVGA